MSMTWREAAKVAHGRGDWESERGFIIEAEKEEATLMREWHHPQVARDVPFDRSIIETMRNLADVHESDPYATVPMTMNWLWFSRMVATMEKGLK